MNLKLLTAGLLSAALSAAPALAHGRITHTTTTTSNGHVAATPFICDDDTFRSSGGFARFITTHASHGFTWGNSSDDSEWDGGLRLDANSQVRAGSFSVDWNYEQDSNDPFIVVVITDSDGSYEQWDKSLCQLRACDQPPFSFTDLSNGFTRITYTGSQDEIDSNSRFASIYFGDEFVGEVGSDTVTNIFVNGIAVIPNTHSGPLPVFDCTGED
jgi:hypothetical protein